jgi:uncharacterized protein (DUF885 family)
VTDEPYDDATNRRFAQVAHAAMDALLELDPPTATAAGDHRFDDRLPDRSPEGLAAGRDLIETLLGQVDAVDDFGLSGENLVDLEILRAELTRRLFELEHVRPVEWNPLTANPGTALYLLLARDFAPLADRLQSLAGRLAAVPEFLARSRGHLAAGGGMPRVHVETALVQLAGTRTLVESQVGDALALEPLLRGDVEPVQGAALAALDEHLAWLRAQLATSDRDPRLGEELYAGRLWHALDAETTPDAVLVRAESELMRIEAEIADIAAGRDVRGLYDAIADAGPVDDASILPLCEQALDETTEFVRAHDLVTLPDGWDDLVQIIVMPEIHRGVAVAYCDPPGPLETPGPSGRPLKTFFAISPTPADWPAERVRSFYREYNAHAVRNLTVHEAMPGHVLQLAHARSFRADSPVRAAFWSGPFVEGWAVHAEVEMATRGFGGEALRLQQLKMHLRMAINAILDVRVHARGMTEAEAMELMTVRGHQEEGEAAGKWRRAQLTSTQLSTYFVGHSDVSRIAADLAVARPGRTVREHHDAMLAHGSPPPRHLRSLLGLSGDEPHLAG